MKFKNTKDFFLICSLLAATSYCYAETNLVIGKTLSPQEVENLKGAQIKLGEQSFTVVTNKSSSNKVVKNTPNTSTTYVVNDRGLVGLSQNIVLISEISPAQVHSSAKEIVNSAISVKYYDHLNISSLKFKDFNQAVLARDKLLELFPNARITIPIKFSEPSVR